MTKKAHRKILDIQKRERESEWRNLNQASGIQTKPFFELDGTQYYVFPAVEKIPTGRMKSLLAFMDEEQMRCDREFLKKYVEEVLKDVGKAQKALSGESGKVDLNKAHTATQSMKIMAEHLGKRLSLIGTTSGIMKIASVMVFDGSENLDTYDNEYGKRKIEKWKAGGVDEFFFINKLRSFTGLSDLPESDLQAYIKVAMALEELSPAEVVQMMELANLKTHANPIFQLLEETPKDDNSPPSQLQER